MRCKGRITIPTDESFVEGTKEIAAMWGADAVRDCDGTNLPKNVKELAEKVYNTYFIVRGDNEWANKHPEETHRTFLMSARNLAESDTLSIDPMQGDFAQQIVTHGVHPVAVAQNHRVYHIAFGFAHLSIPL